MPPVVEPYPDIFFIERAVFGRSDAAPSDRQHVSVYKR